MKNLGAVKLSTHCGYHQLPCKITEFQIFFMVYLTAGFHYKVAMIFTLSPILSSVSQVFFYFGFCLVFVLDGKRNPSVAKVG